MKQKQEIELNRLIRIHNDEVEKAKDGWMVIKIPFETYLSLCKEL